ncbi:MAG: FkbM family methyltransferase [Alphaproteobacteria bacterium]|nr:FkbM family methyltransferase [Alphaproteobacteria bacterium]HRI76993.1 FkbM family methyltransferase [Alphaproteobacteria bacterium]
MAAADTTSPFGTYALSGWRARALAAAQAMPANWLGRRGALLMRKLVLKGGPAIIDAEVEGVRFRLYMRDNVSERKYLFLPQFFDAQERKMLRETLAGGVFVDIGANAGIYSLCGASAVGETGRVLSIEPNPAVAARLKFNISLNGFDARTHVEQAGVSDSAGHFDLVLDETNLGGSSLALQRSEKAISVRCDLLQNILSAQGITHIDALKIDIEGAEDRALIPFLRDAPPSLHPRLVVIENSQKDWQQDLPAAFAAAGYRLQATTRMNLIYIKDGK